MKHLKTFLHDIFGEESTNLNLAGISSALSDATTRTIWLIDCLDEIKEIHLKIDKKLLSGPEYGLIDLCARRKAIQDVLEMVMTAQRKTGAQKPPHNPLDRVTR